jgi:hypothetical protein
VRIVVGIEPRAYREAIAAALATERPQDEVVAVEPGALDAALATLRPDLVICSRLTAAVERGAAWIELYPGGSSGANVGIGRERTQLSELDLPALTRLIDRAAGVQLL